MSTNSHAGQVAGAGLPGDGDALAPEDPADIDAPFVVVVAEDHLQRQRARGQYPAGVANFCGDGLAREVSFYHQQFCAPRCGFGDSGAQRPDRVRFRARDVLAWVVDPSEHAEVLFADVHIAHCSELAQ